MDSETYLHRIWLYLKINGRKGLFQTNYSFWYTRFHIQFSNKNETMIYIDIGYFPTQNWNSIIFYMICSKLLPVETLWIFFPVQNSTSWGRWIEPFLGAYLAIFALIRLRVGLDGWEIPGTKYGKQRIDLIVVCVCVYIILHFESFLIVAKFSAKMYGWIYGLIFTLTA